MAGAAAKRYARAAFELAQEAGDLDGWLRRLELVGQVLDNPDVRRVMANPAIPIVERQRMMDRLAVDGMGREGVNLAKLLIGAGQVAAIDDVIEEFQALADEAAGRVRATVTAAVGLEPEQLEGLRSRLSRHLDRDVRVEVHVDPDVLGGLTVRYGDHLVDASVASRLQQLRRVLTRQRLIGSSRMRN